MIFTGCNLKTEPISFNKNLQGGLFETAYEGKEISFYNRDEQMTVDTTSNISFKHFEQLLRGNPPMDGMAVLLIKLDEIGTKKLRDMTTRNIKKQVCLIVNDQIVVAPIVSSAIINGQLELIMSIRDFEHLSTLLEQ